MKIIEDSFMVYHTEEERDDPDSVDPTFSEFHLDKCDRCDKPVSYTNYRDDNETMICLECGEKVADGKELF